MKFTLRQLEVFLATARTQNLSRAAVGLAMSQSAASGALKELETQFAVRLFDRLGKRLQLNDAGRLLLPKAEELLSRARELEHSLLPEQGLRTLKVGATLSIGNHLCVPLIDRYRRQYPDSRISLDISNTESIIHRVAGFELDIGMIEGEINDPLFEIIPWLEDDLLLFSAADHPLAEKATLTRTDLVDARWVLRENGSGTRQTFNRVMHDLLPQLNVILEIQQPEAIMQSVRAGMGIGCLSRLTLQDQLRQGMLVPLQARGRTFRRRFYLIMHRQKYRSTAMQHWLSLCLDDGAAGPP